MFLAGSYLLVEAVVFHSILAVQHYWSHAYCHAGFLQLHSFCTQTPVIVVPGARAPTTDSRLVATLADLPFDAMIGLLLCAEDHKCHAQICRRATEVEVFMVALLVDQSPTTDSA